MRVVAICLVTTLSFVAGCSRKDDAKDKPAPTQAADEAHGKPGACDDRKDTETCTEYEDDSAKSTCTGAWIDKCPPGDLGTCDDSNEYSKNVRRHYYAGDAYMTEDQAKDACVNTQGKWLGK